MRRVYGVAHGIAECKDCDWQTQSYKNAQALAARHAAHYKHKVEGELGIVYAYDGRARGREP